MGGLQIDPVAVVGLADAFADRKAPLEAIGTRLRQPAQPFNSSANLAVTPAGAAS